LSAQLPLLLVPVVSGPLYVSCGLQEAIPEVASVPLHWSETGERYQPAPFGPVVAATLVDGGVASTLSCFVVTAVVPPELVAEQVRVVPVFGSSMRIAGSQPVVESTADSGSETVQWTTMKLPLALPRYQPLLPSIPSIEYAMSGGVSS
jgi:hypothetical protein